MSKLRGDPGYRGGWCIHYQHRDANGKEVDHCEAGVKYASFQSVKFATRPCFLEKGQSKPDAEHCQHLRRPTAEEMAAHEAWSTKRREALFTVLAAIGDWRAEHVKAHKAGQKTMDCPACGAKDSLFVSIAARNGHVHGKCKTEGCVSWIE